MGKNLKAIAWSGICWSIPNQETSSYKTTYVWDNISEICARLMALFAFSDPMPQLEPRL